jgi:hypothetical protein
MSDFSRVHINEYKEVRFQPALPSGEVLWVFHGARLWAEVEVAEWVTVAGSLRSVLFRSERRAIRVGRREWRRLQKGVK